MKSEQTQLLHSLKISQIADALMKIMDNTRLLFDYIVNKNFILSHKNDRFESNRFNYIGNLLLRKIVTL